jgi:hypothetical protein
MNNELQPIKNPANDPAVRRRILLTGLVLGIIVVSLFAYTFFKFGR